MSKQTNDNAVQASEQSPDIEREEARRASRDDIADLVAGVAREVKGPLAGIIGYSELAMELSRKGKLRTYLERIHAEGKRAYGILQDLLFYAAARRPEPRNVEIDDLVRECLNVENRRFKKAGIRIDTRFGIEGPVQADPVQLQQVVVNLLENAVQAMEGREQPGVLRVETACPDADRVTIRFEDNGPGVPAEIADRVFAPFVSAGEDGGPGLGLSAARGIVAAHGGSLELDNSTTGACFTITLLRHGPGGAGNGEQR